MTTTTTRMTVPALTTLLAVDLLRNVYSDRIASIEAAPSDRQVLSPDSLPAIRVRPKGLDRSDYGGHIFGSALVLTFTDPEHPFQILTGDFMSSTGRVHDVHRVQGSGDIRAIEVSDPVTRLIDGVSATASTWKISHALPVLPVLPEGAALSHTVAAFTNGLALAIARPFVIAGRRSPHLRAVLLGHTLANDVPPLPCEAETGYPIRVRSLAMSLLVHPVGGSCSWAEAESHAARVLDSYSGRVAEGMGRVSMVTIDAASRSDQGIRLEVSLRLAYQPREGLR